MYKNVSPEEVYNMINTDNDIVLVDVRTPTEHQDLGCIKDTIKLPLQELPEKFSTLPKEKKLIMICQRGGRSQKACEILAMQGFENLYNMTGGMSEWPYDIHKRTLA